jgi:ATP-dependent DNA ligase
VSAAAHLRCRSAILDGEVIVQDANGISDFGALRSAIDYEPHRLLFYAFDLLHLNGKDLRGVPLIERRDALRRLLDGAAGDGAIQFSEHTAGGGAKVFAAADRMGLEGIVSKRATSRYVSGSSRNWLKTKCFAESELILIGTEIGKHGKPVALLARHAEGKLAFAGGALIALPTSAARTPERAMAQTRPCRQGSPPESGRGGTAACHGARAGGRRMNSTTGIEQTACGDQGGVRRGCASRPTGHFPASSAGLPIRPGS